VPARAILQLPRAARKGFGVFSDIGSESCSSGDLVPDSAAPYLKAVGKDPRHYAKEQG